MSPAKQPASDNNVAVAQLASDSKSSEAEAELHTEVKSNVTQIGDELKKIGALVRDSAPVQSAIRAYEAEAKVLHDTTTADVTAKSFALLTKAKDNTIAAAKAVNNTPIVLELEDKITKLHAKGATAVKRLEENAQKELHDVKVNAHLGWMPDKLFQFMIVVLVVAVAMVAAEYGRAHFASTPARHGGFSTPGTNKAEDSLYEILGEIKHASDTAFEKAFAEVQTYGHKHTAQLDAHVKEAHEAAIRAIKSLQQSLVNVESKTASSLRDIVAQTSAKIGGKLGL